MLGAAMTELTGFVSTSVQVLGRHGRVLHLVDYKSSHHGVAAGESTAAPGVVGGVCAQNLWTVSSHPDGRKSELPASTAEFTDPHLKRRFISQLNLTELCSG